MATIVQVPGQLNVQSVLGQSIAFSAVLAGDLTADTWTATLNNGSTTITLATSDSYLAPDTTISISLSVAQAATLTLASYTWQLVQTTTGVDRTLLAGTWTIVNGY